MARTSTRTRTGGKRSRARSAKHVRLNPPEIKASPNYSHAVMVQPEASFLAISGQVGRDADGAVPAGIAAQTELAWRNVRTVLEAAGMGMQDVVSYVSYLVRREDASTYSQVRLRVLGNARPASTLIFVAGLGASTPELLCEVQVLAAKVAPNGARRSGMKRSTVAR